MPKDKPKKLTPQQWEQEQLKKGYKYAFNETPDKLEMRRKSGAAPVFYNPEEYALDGEVVRPLKGGDPMKAYIKYGELMEQDPTQPTQSKTRVAPKRQYVQPVEGRKPIEFGPYQNFDPNTGKYYDPISGQEITPVIEGKKKGGLVKKYGMGGAVTMAGKTGAAAAEELAKQSGSGMMGAGTQGAASSLAGPLSALGTTAATAIQAGNTPNEQGEINEGKAALSGGLKYASTVAPIAANPALLAATGGLSALAIPVAGGIGAIVEARKAGENNDKAVAEFNKQKLADETAKSDSRIQEAIRKRELGYSKGGKIVGKGTGTSDGITAKVRAGSFIVPAKNAEIAEEIREKVLRKAPSKKANLSQGGGVEVKLSNGEHMFDENEAKEIEIELGPEIFKMLAPESEDVNELGEDYGEMASGGKVSISKAKEILRDGTAHGKPLTDKQKRYFGWMAGGGMKCGGMVKGYAKGGTVTGDDDEKFINDKRKELDALKKQLDDAAAKEAKTVQEKRAAENKKIAYEAAKKRFDEAVDKFQKAKEGYSRYEKAVNESTKKYPKEASGNTERLKVQVDELDKLRKDMKEKAAVIEKASPKQSAATPEAKESTTKVKPYTAGGEQVDLTRPKETKTATEIPATTTTAGTKRAAPKRTASTEMSAAKKAEIANTRSQFQQNAMDTIDQDYADVMAETAALEKGLPKEYEPTVNPPSPSNPVGNKMAQPTQAAGQTASPNWQGGLTQALGYGIPALQTAVGASALSKLGKRPIDKLDPEYLQSIQQAKDRALQAEKEAQFGMTAEEKFLLGQENQGLLNQSRAAARNYSGGSGATAFQQERMGIQDAYGRGLLTKVRDNALKLQKQGIAADRAAYADQLIAGKTDMNRRLFNDQLQAWQQNQLAAGDLTSQGLSNLMSQNRYNQFLQNRESYQ